MIEINKLCVNKQRQSMKIKKHLQKSMAKKEALSKQTALVKAASTIYSIIYNSIEIGRQSWLINLTFLNRGRITMNKKCSLFGGIFYVELIAVEQTPVTTLLQSAVHYFAHTDTAEDGAAAFGLRERPFISRPLAPDIVKKLCS